MRLRVFSLVTAMAVAVAMTAFVSCIKEEAADCPTRLLITIDKEIERVSPGRYDHIHSVRVYVFDKQTGLYVTTVESDRAYVVGQPYELTADIPAGDYDFVVWTNLSEPYYALSGAPTADTHIDDLRVSLDMAAVEQSADIPDLHHGRARRTIVASQTNTVEIVIVPNTYRVRFTVGGLPVNGHEYQFEATDEAFSYNFHNDISAAEHVREFNQAHVTGFTDDGKLTVSMTLLSLGERRPRFALSDLTAGLSLYPHGLAGAAADMVDMIVEAYKIRNDGREPDFDKEFDFLVPLEYTIDLGVRIDLNPWDGIDQDENL